MTLEHKCNQSDERQLYYQQKNPLSYENGFGILAKFDFATDFLLRVSILSKTIQ